MTNPEENTTPAVAPEAPVILPIDPVKEQILERERTEVLARLTQPLGIAAGYPIVTVEMADQNEKLIVGQVLPPDGLTLEDLAIAAKDRALNMQRKYDRMVGLINDLAHNFGSAAGSLGMDAEKSTEAFLNDPAHGATMLLGWAAQAGKPKADPTTKGQIDVIPMVSDVARPALRGPWITLGVIIGIVLAVIFYVVLLSLHQLT